MGIIGDQMAILKNEMSDFDWIRLEEEFIIEFSYHSNALEGNSLSLAEVRELFRKENR